MKPYRHKVQYYETDMMGLTHHSNYIRWMEEARVDFMDQLGFPYARMEAEGIVSPVRALSCEYAHPTVFGDEIDITVRVESFNGVVMTIAYDMVKVGSGTVCSARSEHVFLKKDGGFARLKRDLPAFYDAVAKATGEGI